LALGWWIVLGRLGRAATPALLGLVSGPLGLVARPCGFGLGASLLFQPGAGGIQFGLQRFTPGDLGG
jgi:hypothetical protein